MNNPVSQSRWLLEATFVKILFRKHQLPKQAFEVYQSEMLPMFSTCNSGRGPKSLAYLTFNGITDKSLRDAIFEEVEGDDTKLTKLTMEILERVRSIFTFNKLARAIGNDNNSGKNNGNGGKKNDGNGKNSGGKKNRGGMNPNSTNKKSSASSSVTSSSSGIGIASSSSAYRISAVSENYSSRGYSNLTSWETETESTSSTLTAGSQSQANPSDVDAICKKLDHQTNKKNQDDDFVEIVGVVKPRHERTPEIIDLSSEETEASSDDQN